MANNIGKIVLSGTIIGSVALSGCATSQSAFFDRSVIEDTVGIEEQHSTLALTAERRLAIFKGSRACAEALPDVGRSIDASSKLSGALKELEKLEGNAELEEAYKTALTVLYQRTEKSDLVRQIGWQICQAHLNDAISDVEYKEFLFLMVAAALTAGAEQKNLPLESTLKQLKAFSN